ncbi:MFS transporter [Acinetobacter sp. SwsAc6]|jgi:MFS family permease|uniref:MFS transporter n=1 Tax=Acinetobacter TaxID=469 RepID=UPI000D116E40|nr:MULTISPECIES: MFS transporter [Acinetobacter]NWK73603.1 MFS transporter [Acinetobacter sp. SwsAc6]QCO22494.1 MFS transporter [Acinetobacter cumulans]
MSAKVQWFAKDLLIIGAGFAAAMHIGKLPAAIPILQAELGLSLVQSGLLLSCIQCAGMCFALLIGSYVSKLGLKRCVLLGLSLLTLASICAGLTQSVLSLFSMRIIEGFGFLLVTLSGPALIRELAPIQSLPAKMGLWAAYMGGGVGIALITAPMLIQSWSWSVVWFSYAFITLSFLIGIAWFIPNTTPSSQAVPLKSLIKLTLQHQPAWLLALIFGTYAGQWFALVGFLPTIYEQNHIAPTLAGLLTASVSIANAVGTFICGLLLQRGLQAKLLVILGFVVLIACALLFYTAKDSLPFMLQYVLVFGFSLFGGLVAGSIFAQALHFSPSPMAISTTVGMILQCSALSQFLLPPSIALLVSSTGTWLWVGVLMSVLSILGIVLTQRLFAIQPKTSA